MADDQATEETPVKPAPAASPAAKPAEAEEPTFALARILHPVEGPAVLGVDFHTIAGAFHDLIVEARADEAKLEDEFTRSAALARVEEWLKRPEEVDNANTPVPAGTPAPDDSKAEAA